MHGEVTLDVVVVVVVVVVVFRVRLVVFSFVHLRFSTLQAFELATGDFLFEPHSGEDYSRDEGNMLDRNKDGDRRKWKRKRNV